MQQSEHQHILHLICNSHIDPVWLWEWEEGLAETLSTFRIAADFCTRYKGFVFCHNEALLYQWVEEYDPALFKKIRKLIGEDKWKIIGGWYLQPDCNLPSGESFVRQILVGKNYFRKKFNAEPQTAVNFDPFGHSRGLVQILKKSGYTSYLFCRPGEQDLSLPEDFIWTGFDGSEILAHRSNEHYNSEKGKAGEKLDRWMKNHTGIQDGLFLWGIGNHGGGPSKIDINQLQARMDQDPNIQHSWPEPYFEWLNQQRSSLPKHAGDLNPWAVGCYTSMSRIKNGHRQLEGRYYLTEMMLTHACISGLLKYPAKELHDALEDLLFCEFHDILPGSAIPEVEQYALQRIHHGLETLSRLRTKAFFKLLAGQPSARKEEMPILVYNPEPYEIEETLTVELQGPEPNFNPELFLLPELHDEGGNPIEYQLEKESANIANDHRKRLVFRAKLKPFAMNRFSCYLRLVSILDKPMNPVQDELTFINDISEIRINPETGLIDQYKVHGFDYLKTDSAELLVMNDNADPWGMKVNSFSELAGRFRLMSPSETARFAGTQGPVEPVRIIENGPIRVVVEGLFKYQNSTAMVRYLIPKKGAAIDIQVRVFWMEKDRMLKMAFPGKIIEPDCLGQVAFGVQKFDREGEELVAQNWVGLFSPDSEHALTIANQTTYGFDYSDGQIRLSLLRSPAYAGHPINDVTPIVRQDRLTQRIDQGEHFFVFRIHAGQKNERLEQIDLESRQLNVGAIGLCCFPDGKGKIHQPAVALSDPSIRISALKMAEDSDNLIIRLFETTGTARTLTVRIPMLDLNIPLSLSEFEIKTLSINTYSKEIQETDLLEQS